MANAEHFEILKQGVAVWNKWREKNPDIRPDLGKTDLKKKNLGEINLRGVTLFGADLSGTDLRKADLSFANFRSATLEKANLEQAKLLRVDFSRAILKGVNLHSAVLSRADFDFADLSNADLSETILRKANFARATFSNTNFTGAILSLTTFVNVDLGTVQGLETVTHESPSSIGVGTIYRSKGKISEEFLQKAGVPVEITDHLLKTDAPIVPYTREQIETWLASLQKRLTIILRNIARLEEKKSLVGPIDVPLKILNELDEYEIERVDVEAQIVQFKQYEHDLN